MAKMHSSLKIAFYLIGFAFVGLLVATYITVKISMQGHEGIVDPNYYEKGLKYEKHLEANKKMIEAGYRFESSLLTAPSILLGKNNIAVGLFKNENKVSDAKVYLTIERSATNKFNQKIELSFKDDKYLGELEVPKNGIWVITLIALVPNEGVLQKTVQVTVQ